jgi:excisionase family DNA binding protein
MTTNTDSLMKIRDAAAALRIHPGSLYRLCARRGIIFYRIPGVGLRFRPSDLDKFIDRSRRTKKDFAAILRGAKKEAAR